MSYIKGGFMSRLTLYLYIVGLHVKWIYVPIKINEIEFTGIFCIYKYM